MKETKKAIAYFRVSTDMQRDDLSLETQEKGGEIFAKDNNIEIVKKFTLMLCLEETETERDSLRLKNI